MLEKPHRARSVLGRPDLGKGNARMIIDGHVGVIVCHATCALLPVPRDAVAHDPDAGQAFDVHMQQLAWRGPFIAARQHYRL
jgi:hypothetical protein